MLYDVEARTTLHRDRVERLRRDFAGGPLLAPLGRALVRVGLRLGGGAALPEPATSLRRRRPSAVRVGARTAARRVAL